MCTEDIVDKLQKYDYDNHISLTNAILIKRLENEQKILDSINEIKYSLDTLEETNPIDERDKKERCKQIEQALYSITTALENINYDKK